MCMATNVPCHLEKMRIHLKLNVCKLIATWEVTEDDDTKISVYLAPDANSR